MVVRFWGNIAKKPNSTKLPAGNPAKEIDAILTEGCSITAPVINISGWYNFGYAYIPAWNRYYFIRNVEFLNSRTFFTLEEDYLASYRASIGASSHYVTRSASAYNSDIVDSLYPTFPEVNILESTTNSKFTDSGFVIQYVGNNGVRSAQVSTANFATICANLWQNYSSIEGITNTLLNITDPFQYVLGVQKTYIPASAWDNTTISSQQITLGIIPALPGNYTHITNAVGTMDYSLSVPKHPQAGERAYLKSSPYSAYSLKLPGVGWIQLNANDLYSVDTIQIVYRFEPTTGKFRADVYANAKTIASAEGSANLPWAIGSTAVSLGDVTKGVTGAGQAILSGIAMNPVGMVSGVASAVDALTPTLQMKGGVSGCVGMNEVLRLQLKYQEVADENITEHGRPLMEVKQINTLSGYIICDNADFNGAPLREENEAINSYLNGGFYYE